MPDYCFKYCSKQHNLTMKWYLLTACWNFGGRPLLLLLLLFLFLLFVVVWVTITSCREWPGWTAMLVIVTGKLCVFECRMVNETKVFPIRLLGPEMLCTAMVNALVNVTPIITGESRASWTLSLLLFMILGAALLLLYCFDLGSCFVL